MTGGGSSSSDLRTRDKAEKLLSGSGIENHASLAINCDGCGSNILPVVGISRNLGQKGTDPYGHIHGRQVTTSLPGIYLVGFRVIDISTNGAGGGPIHTPSDILEVRFQAGARIETLQLLTNRVAASFRSPPGISNVLERSESIPSTDWQQIGPPIRGNNSLQAFTDTNAPTHIRRFYRLRQLNNLP